MVDLMTAFSLPPAEKTLKAVEEKIIRYSVSTMEVTGPVGESPVHLAFLFGLSDLGKRSLKSTKITFHTDLIVREHELSCLDLPSAAVCV